MAGTTKLMTPGGGGVSLTPASSIASDVTVNVPSQNCTLGIQGPAFSVNLTSAQNCTTGTETKLQFNNERWDTNNCFDSTSYRFLPNVAGYYHITSNCYVGSAASSFLSLYKNGSVYMRGSQESANQVMVTFSGDVYLNGTTDYIEMYLRNNTGSTIVADAYDFTTTFSGCFVRSA